jgi:hypothetical protein
MIVERATYFAKNGQQAKMAEMVQEQIDGNTAFTGAYRIYLADIGGPHNAVVVEWEHEDVPAMRAAWKAWGSKPETPEFIEKLREVSQGGGHTETWRLVAKR